VFEAEPRSVNWKPGQPSLKLEAVAALAAARGDKRREVLTGFLALEDAAAREDLASGYPECPMFVVVSTRLARELGRVGTQETITLLRKMIADAEGVLPAKVNVELYATVLDIEDRLAGQADVGERARRILGMLTGRYPSGEDQRGMRGLTEKALREYGAQAYLIMLGMPALEEIIPIAKDGGASQPRRAEAAWLAARILQETLSLGGERALGLGPHLVDTAAILYAAVHPQDSRYVDDAVAIVVQLPRGNLGSEAVNAVQALRKRVVAAEQQMTPKQLAEKAFGKPRQPAPGAVEPSERAKKQIAQIAGEPADSFAFLARYLQDAEQSVREAAVGRFRMAIETAETRKRLRDESLQMLALFESHKGSLSVVTDLAVIASGLCVDEPSLEAANAIVLRLAASKDSMLRYASTLIVRLVRDERLLKPIKSLLTDKNTWVRRCAEEAYEELGYRTWRGEVVGKTEPSTQPASQPAEESERTFQKDLADAVAASNAENAEMVAALVERMSGTAAQSTLLEAVGDPNTDAKTKNLALRCLVANGSESVIEPVLRLVRESENEEFLNAVAEAMGHLRNPEAIPLLIQAACDGTDSRLGGACSLAVARMPGEEPARVLLKAYTKGVTDAGNREIIARGIAAIRAPEAVAILVEAAREWQDDRLGAACVAGLGSIETAEAMSALLDLAGVETVTGKAERLDAIAQAVSIAAAQQRQEAGAVQAVIEHLRSPSAAVRLTAAKALGGFKEDPAVLKALQDAAKSESDPSVLAAIRASLVRADKKSQ
jgi:HEAT repeat protein